MGTKTSFPWGMDWLESQRQYIDAWKSFCQFLPKPEEGQVKNPWADAMDYWWRAVSSSAPQGSEEFITKIMEQGKIFYLLSEQFIKLLKNINEVGKTSGNWQEVLNAQFEEMKTLFTKAQGNTRDAMLGILGAWQLLPMDTLQRTFSSASLMPGDFLEDLKPDGLKNVTDKFLSIPGVGYTRESQEQIQKSIKLWSEYQKTYLEYNNAMCKVAVNALECMRTKMLKMGEEGKEFTSLRAIYDLWIDCNEEAYAAFAYSEEFSQLYGRLTNALMAVKQHERNIIDKAFGALNMPTRRGMNTMQKHQQELRRECKGAINKIRGLEEEIISIHKKISGHSADKSRAFSANTAKMSVTGKKSHRKGASNKKENKKKENKTKKNKTEENKRKPGKKRTAKKTGKTGMIVIKI